MKIKKSKKTNWVNDEFGEISLGDIRLDARFIKTTELLSQRTFPLCPGFRRFFYRADRCIFFNGPL